MTVHGRRVASIPVRSATASWDFIIDLVAPTNQEARDELRAASGVAASLITREAMKEAPIVVLGSGPRLRIYCIYGQDAIENTHVHEASLPASPAETDDWLVSLPCPEEDLLWVTAALEDCSPRIVARDSRKPLPEDEEDNDSSDVGSSIDQESFLRP